MYREFLETCAYTPEEIEKELPRVKRAFDRAGLSEEDVKRGRERLIEYFEAGELRGMRMISGIWIKEFVDLVLAGEEHEIRLYFHLPSVIGSLFGGARLARPDVYVGYPDVLCHYVLGSVFNRLDPLLEATENWCLPPGVAHCACNQAKLGGKLLNIIAPGSLHFSMGAYCDEAPKVEELLEYHFGERVFWCNRCQDEDFDDPMDERHLKYLSTNVDRARRVVSEVIGVEVTKDMVMEAILASEGCVNGMTRIADLRAEADPSPLRIGSCAFAQFLIVVVTVGLKRRKELEEALRVLGDEVQERVDRGEGVVEKGAPRVMLSYTPPLSTPGIAHAMEDAGLNVCCTEGYGTVSAEDRRVEIGLPDPCDLIAGVYLHNPMMMKPTWRVDAVVAGYRKTNLDGIIMLPHYSCRVFGNDYMMVRDGVKKELGNIPILILETDLFDPRYYTAEQSRTRIESFAEMAKTAKAAV